MKMERLATRPSLAAEIAARLRSSILNGDLKPNQKIAVSAIAKDLGVSHIPVREAIQRLMAESLVQSVPNQGPKVAGVRLEDLHDVYYLRRLIEGDAACRAASLYGDQDVERIQHSLEVLLGASPESPEGEFWNAHRDFHRAILQPALNSWSELVINLLWQNAERYHRLFTLVFGSLRVAHGEHRALAEAAAARDGERLQSLLITHLNHTEEAVTNGYMKAHGDPDAKERSAYAQEGG
jgi:DNA-binding GntR family transcriptional regulator